MTTETLVAPSPVEYLLNKVGFYPHSEQDPIISCRHRFILVTGGDRAGKSLTSEKHALARIFEDEEPDLYWLVAVEYERTRAEFEYFMEDFAKLGMLKFASKRVDPGRIELHDGTRIETKSAKEPRSLVMKAPKGIILCEAGQVELEVYERLSTRVAEKRGWLFMSGSLEGSLGWYPRLKTAWKMGYDNKISFELPTWTNVTSFPGGRYDPEILRLEAEHSDDFFMQRVAGQVVPPRGLVFHEVRPDLHVVQNEWIPDETVYIFEDPGYGSESAHAIEVAHVITEYTPDGKPWQQVRVFDEIYEQGKITTDIIDMCMARPWWKAENKVLVSDPHYKDQHHSQSSVSEIWMKETGLYAHGERVKILSGIERLKSFLKPDPVSGIPRIIFSPRCKGILSEFGIEPHPLRGTNFGETKAYRWRTDRDGNVVGANPEQKYNHGISATIYGLIDLFGYGIIAEKRRASMRRH